MPKDQNASLRHIVWDAKFLHSKPAQYSIDPPDGIPKENFTLALTPEQRIADIRGSDETFELDTHGFTVRENPLPPMKWDDENIEKNYLPMLSAMVREEVPDATKVVAFDYRVGYSTSLTAKLSPQTNALKKRTMC